MLISVFTVWFYALCFFMLTLFATKINAIINKHIVHTIEDKLPKVVNFVPTCYVFTLYVCFSRSP